MASHQDCSCQRYVDGISNPDQLYLWLSVLSHPSSHFVLSNGLAGWTGMRRRFVGAHGCKADALTGHRNEMSCISMVLYIIASKLVWHTSIQNHALLAAVRQRLSTGIVSTTRDTDTHAPSNPYGHVYEFCASHKYVPCTRVIFCAMLQC
jgi:hypothetical protein